jgi:hypothetical protein
VYFTIGAFSGNLLCIGGVANTVGLPNGLTTVPSGNNKPAKIAEKTFLNLRELGVLRGSRFLGPSCNPFLVFESLSLGDQPVAEPSIMLIRGLGPRKATGSARRGAIVSLLRSTPI